MEFLRIAVGRREGKGGWELSGEGAIGFLGGRDEMFRLGAPGMLGKWGGLVLD